MFILLEKRYHYLRLTKAGKGLNGTSCRTASQNCHRRLSDRLSAKNLSNKVACRLSRKDWNSMRCSPGHQDRNLGWSSVWSVRTSPLALVLNDIRLATINGLSWGTGPNWDRAYYGNVTDEHGEQCEAECTTHGSVALICQIIRSWTQTRKTE
jgi:hypothetical protein